MKKYKTLSLLAFALTFGFTSQTFACEAGTPYTDTYGTHFCISNIAMNWWSAFTWCSTQHYTLASIQQACPGATYQQLFNGISCSNLKTTDVLPNQWLPFWTTEPVTDGTRALMVQTKGNYSGPDNRSVSKRALCVMSAANANNN